MYMEGEARFSNAQALTASAVGTNTIDLVTARSIGNGMPLSVVFVVKVAADQTSGNEDYTFDVEIATNAAQSTGRQLLGRRVFESGTPTAPAQDADLLVAGFQFTIPIPVVSLDEAAQYLGVRYTLAGTTPTITVTSFLTPTSMVQSPKTMYAAGYSIS